MPPEMMMMNSAPSANGYPIQGQVADVLTRLVGGLPAGQNQVWTRPWKFYHKLNFPNNGSLNNVARLQFFNVAYTKFITNMQQASVLPSNYGFALAALRVEFVYGIDVNGARATCVPTSGTLAKTALNFGAFAAAASDLVGAQWKAQEKIRELLNSGLLTFSVGERPVLETWGLTNFPSGRGVVQNASGDSSSNSATVGSTQHAVAAVSNGAPVMANRYAFAPLYPLVAGQQFGVTIDFPTPVDFTEAALGPFTGETAGAPAGHFVCELEGTLISPGSA